MEFINKIKRLKKPNAPWKKYYEVDDIELSDDTIYELLEKSALDNPERYAIEYFGKKTKFKVFLKQIDDCAKAFKAQGIQSKDVVTLCMPNTPEAVICFYALNKIGAISNMIHPLSGEEEIKNYLINNHTKLLVTIDIALEKIMHILNDTDVNKVVVASPKDSMPVLLGVGYSLTQGRKFKKVHDSKYIYYHDFIKLGKKETVETVSCKRDTPAVILHSGGTTGSPKGIVLSNGNFNALVKQATVTFDRLNPDEDSILTIMPLFHGFGLGVCTHTPLCLGVKTILVPQFSAKTFDKLLDKTKPTVVIGVPTLYEALTNSKNVPNLDLSRIKYLISGGDSLSESQIDKINNYLKAHGCKIDLAQGYGMTESLAATAFTAGPGNKKGSIGIPFLGNYYKIVDPETGDTLGPNEDGEICVCGPTIMLGYLDNEVETNNVLRIHSDGYVWLHTGDIGCMDEDGVFYYKQRLKRMIISSGYNVYPSYIENIIEQHPAVLSCTVIGIPHPYKIEVPKAFIVLRSDYHGIGSTKKSIKSFCEKHLSKHSVPYEFEFRKSLPRTLIGKVDFKKLMAEEEEKRKKEKKKNEEVS